MESIFDVIKKEQLKQILRTAATFGDNQMIQKAFSEVIEKGGKANIGEIREWKGGKFKKTAQGWVPVLEGKDKKLVEDKPEKDSVAKEEIIDFKNEIKLWIDAIKTGSNKEKKELIESATRSIFDKIKSKISNIDDIDEKYKILENIKNNNPLVQSIVSRWKDSLRHSIRIKHF